MKNLNLWDVSVKHLDINSNDEHFICYGHDEGNSGELYICSHTLVVKKFAENGEEKWRKDLSEVASPDNRPVGVTFLSLPNVLCIGLANGELFTVGDSGNSCDLVGVCDNGLLAMEWSPDQELMVLVTKDLKTILMSCTFDPIHEERLHDLEFGEKQFITVGWGKKETQFHGSEGKQAAKVKTEVVADQNAASENKVKVTWRGDGNLYAIGFTLDGIRRFKVFDREGHLQYTSEKQPGLEGNLSWRPSGNVIATTQRLPGKYVVAFFEKNGLKHGGFDIPVSLTTVVKDLQWSSDSEILMLQCKDTETNTYKLLLFTIGNYHWYLKQCLVFNSEKCISKILWDNDFEVQNNKKLHVILHDGQYLTYTWIWNIDHSRGNDETDDAVVAVIDGRKLLITGFRQQVIPPPMSSLVVELDSFVSSVHFAPQKQSKETVDTNSFFAITVDNNLVNYEQTSKFPLQYEVKKVVKLEDYEFPFKYFNWHWMNDVTIVCITAGCDESYQILEYNLVEGKIVKTRDENLPATVSRINSHPTDPTVIFLHLTNGDIVRYGLGGIFEPIDVSFASPCPKFNVFSLDHELHFIGLSHKGNLYMDDQMIMNNVSSFFVHTHFLLLTTLQHVLLCTPLTKSGLKAINEYVKTESAHVYRRKIERGAKLVIAVAENTKTVFQMPRGNLETVQPRPLTLKIVGKYLDSLKYHEAFDLMRKERINLNLIYDHHPEKFMQHIIEFLESIKNNSWLSLFLSDLENVDVTTTMYSSSYAAERNDKPIDYNKIKIQEVCTSVRSYLKKRPDIDSRILPLLTSYVKTNVIEDLEGALKLIKDLKQREADGTKLLIGSDEALKYLLYMVDVTRLFDVGLGLYDFDLVLLIANKSQKDPKEYIPMLNEFNGMEENYKRFSINKHLKRFDEAVKCLMKCGTEKHGELRTFVKYHSLYNEALRLFKPEDEVYKQISEDFGLYLRLKKQFIDAGIVYERGGNTDKAVECYKDGLEWELAINLVQSWPKETFQELCWDLVNALKEEKRHKEALQILEQFYDNKEEAILYAIANGQYKTALRLCTKYNRSDIKANQLITALLDEHKNLQDLVESNLSNHTRYRNRLRVVREVKRKTPVETYDPAFENRDSDLYSDAGSTVASSSRGSSRSFRSSKNRRKHERKLTSLKEGSQYEDVALVMALHGLIVASFELRLQVREVNIALSWYGRTKEAYVLQTNLEKLLREMKESFKDIWTNELVLEATNASIAAETVPEGVAVIPQGIASLELQMRIAPIIQEISWKLDGLY